MKMEVYLSASSKNGSSCFCLLYTSKLHARGPVGLEGLVSYKYKLFGSGQIVADYASGAKNFHFKNL